MKKLKILILLLVLKFEINIAQTIRCGSDEFESKVLTDNPFFQNYKTAWHESVNSYLETVIANKTTAQDIITIPVIVHLIGNSQMVSSVQSNVQNQINILNQDYAKLIGSNGYGQGVDTKVRFCLATTDPFGFPTSGINLVYGTSFPNSWNISAPNSNSNSDSTLKSLAHWDPLKYLNIYVVAGITNSLGNNLLGYATFPWELQAKSHVDGVVIAKDYFGNTSDANYNIGRTATHEVGHWLGLFHTFQRGINNNEISCKNDNPNSNGDLVSDTPPVSAPNFICTVGLNSCSTDSPDLPDLIENYMDYTPDACMNMFTQGQANRMIATLYTTRNFALFSSCLPTCSNGIQDIGETGIDCGGLYCKPCDYVVQQSDNICKSINFTVNGDSPQNKILNVCTNNILISPINLNCPNINDNCWDFKTFTQDRFCANINDQWAAANTIHYGIFNNRCLCTFLQLFISVQECDNNLNLIGVEQSKWYYIYDNDPSTYNDSLTFKTFNLNGYFIPNGYVLQNGKYYKVKIATYHNEKYPAWRESVAYIKTFDDGNTNTIIQNRAITNNEIGTDVTIINSNASSSLVNLKVVAENKINIQSQSKLSAGRYFIRDLDCNNIKSYRGLNNDSSRTNTLLEADMVQNLYIEKNDLLTTHLLTENDINLFPNPTSNYSILKLNLLKESKVTVVVLDLAGKKLMQISEQNQLTPREGYFEINTTNLVNGVYIIKTNINSKDFYKKLIVWHDK